MSAGEDGFTLIELVVGMLIGTIVMLATFQSLDVFSSNAARQTKIADANDQIRTLMEKTVRDLRGASTVTYAGSQDLIYTVPEAAGTRTKRLCLTGTAIYGFSVLSPATAPTSATPCANGVKLATLKATTATRFTYDGATSSVTPGAVKNVGLTFGLNTTMGARTSASTLTASASRRTGTLLLSDDDLDTTCQSDGALLKLDATIPGVGALTVNYANDGGIAIGTPVTGGVKIPRGITNVVATVTDAAGVTSILRSTVEC